MLKIDKTCRVTDITPHMFRHTFATDCFKSKVEPLLVKQWLGHDSIKTTLDIYTHPTKEDLLDREKMDKYYSEISKQKDFMK